MLLRGEVTISGSPLGTDKLDVPHSDVTHIHTHKHTPQNRAYFVLYCLTVHLHGMVICDGAFFNWQDTNKVKMDQPHLHPRSTPVKSN